MGAHFLQMDGVSMGSCIALTLSEIYVARCNITVGNVIKEQHKVIKIYRYVGGYLVIHSAAGDVEKEKLISKIKVAFGNILVKLTLTKEGKRSGMLTFLGLEFTMNQDYVCSQFTPKIKNELLLSSVHSKLIERSIASGSITSVLNKSFPIQNDGCSKDRK